MVQFIQKNFSTDLLKSTYSANNLSHGLKSLFIRKLWIFICLERSEMWAFFVRFTITSTKLYMLQSFFSFIQAENLLFKKMCVLKKNRRTKGVSYRSNLPSFALKFDVSPPFSSQPFSSVQEQDCHLTLKVM